MQWYAAGAGFISWTLHLLLSYWAVSAACDNHWPGIDVVLHLLTLLAVVATVAAGVVGWRTWRAASRQRGDEFGNPAGRSAFMGLASIGLSTLFLIAIVYGEMATFFVPPCR